MKESQRVLLAGFLMVSVYVLWSIFFAPPILQEPANPQADFSQKDESLDAFFKTDVSSEDPSLFSSSDNFISFSVKGDNFNAVLSSRSGGTFEQYFLNDHLGSYSASAQTRRGGVGYDSSSNYGFLFDDSNGFSNDMLGCNPCVEGVSPSNVSVFFNGNLVERDEELILRDNVGVLTFEWFEEDGLKSQHIITFYNDRSEVDHSYLNLPDIPHVVMWKNGIAPAERFSWEDDNNFCSGFVNVGGDEFWNEQNKEHSVLSSSQIPVEWVGVRNKFFVSAIIPITKNVGASIHPVNDHPFSIKNKYVGLYGRTKAPALTDIKIKFERSSDISFQSLMAPLDYSLLSSYEKRISSINKDRSLNITKIMTMGFWPLSEISKLISSTILFFHQYLYGISYGFILILFAFVVRLLSGPLTKRSMQATQKMQLVQPLIKKAQDKHKSDPKKMQLEIMSIYKKNGVNPLSGCLLMFLQWPIMIPPFIVFRSAVELRGQSFLWIEDLSQPDYLLYLPLDIPFIGTGEGWTGVGILPFLMGITLFLTMKKTMASADGQNKAMLYGMNGMFVLLFNSFPSGLNLYYVFYNLLNYLHQSRSSDKSSSVFSFIGSKFKKKPK